MPSISQLKPMHLWPETFMSIGREPQTQGKHKVKGMAMVMCSPQTSCLRLKDDVMVKKNQRPELLKLTT